MEDPRQGELVGCVGGRVGERIVCTLSPQRLRSYEFPDLQGKHKTGHCMSTSITLVDSQRLDIGDLSIQALEIPLFRSRFGIRQITGSQGYKIM